MSASVGERLKAVRTQKGVKQIDAAKALNISHGLLSHYENGVRQPSLEFLCTASRYYGVTADYLLGLSDLNAVLPPAPVQNPETKEGYEKIVDILTGLYALLTVIDDPELSVRTTDYLGANLYRIFRPLFDIHGVPYDTEFLVNSDTFSLCGASATLSEAATLIRLRALPEETIQMLHALSLEKTIPVNLRSLFDSLKKVDAQIFQCNPEPKYMDGYTPG